MIKATRARYTLEFKQEAVRLVESGQSIASASRTLGLVEQTLFNWVKAHREGTLKGADSRSKVTAEQMEISRLRAELARCTQIPEYVLEGCLAAFKSRNLPSCLYSNAGPKPMHGKKDSVIFVLISRTNFSRNFVRVLCATIRDFSAVTMQSNPGKGLKTNKRISGI